MADNPSKTVMGFALAAFVLLGALFGMQIMAFIFGQLGPDNAGLTSGTNEYNISSDIQNESLTAIRNYSEQAGTQFTTIGITITLLVLILLFLVFWNVFMKKGIGGMGNKGSSAGSFG